MTRLHVSSGSLSAQSQQHQPESAQQQETEALALGHEQGVALRRCSTRMDCCVPSVGTRQAFGRERWKPRLESVATPQMRRSRHLPRGFSRALAERGGFEPPVTCATREFQSRTFGLSVTSPLVKIQNLNLLPRRSLSRRSRCAASPFQPRPGGEGGIRTPGSLHYT